MVQLDHNICPNCSSQKLVVSRLRPAVNWHKCPSCHHYSNVEIAPDDVAPRPFGTNGVAEEKVLSWRLRQGVYEMDIWIAADALLGSIFAGALVMLLMFWGNIPLMIVSGGLLSLIAVAFLLLILRLLRRAFNHHSIRIEVDGTVTASTGPLPQRGYPLTCPPGTKYTCRPTTMTRGGIQLYNFYAHLPGGARLLTPVEPLPSIDPAWLLHELQLTR